MSSTIVKLTPSLVRKLTPCPANSRSKSVEYTDADLTCLKVAVGKEKPKGTVNRTYYFRANYKGKKIVIKLGNANLITLKEAREKALALKREIELGNDPLNPIKEKATSSITLEVFANGPYSDWATENKKSYVSDRSKLDHHIIPLWGDRPLDSISRADIEKYVLELSKKSKYNGKAYSVATINRHISLLKKLFDIAIRWEYIEKNPAKGVPCRKENNIKTTHLKKHQIKQLMAQLDLDANTIAANAIKLLLLTGARTSEILKSKWANYDPELGTIYLEDTKSGKPRYLLTNQAAKDVLEVMQRYQNGPYIFPGKDPSKPYNNIKKPLARVLKAAGLDDFVTTFTPHCLRHTYASLLATEGVSLYQIQQLLGHSTSTVTQRYAHLSPDALKGANQLVSDMVQA